MRAWVYARTSGEEKDTGQDVKAQASATTNAAETQGWEVVGQSMDDGVSGDTDPVERRGFAAAIQAVQSGTAEAVVLAEVSRFSRQHPVPALMAWDQVAGSGVPVVSLKESHFDGRQPADGDKEAVLLRFITFWSSWGERITIKERTALAMREIRSGRRKTKSGRPPGRPCKVSRDDAVEAFAWMRQQKPKASLAAGARWLSQRNGAHKALDPRTAKKRRVGRSTLASAFERYGICDENPNGTETVSVQEGGACGDDGSVSDGGADHV